MDKKITNIEIENLRQELIHSKSEKRKFAAKKIGKFQIDVLGDDLYQAYKKEILDPRTWETQNYMIIAFGKLRYTKAIPDLKNIIVQNKERDMITSSAALSYVRVVRSDLNDALPIIELLKIGNLSVLNGITKVLTYDNMQPPKGQIEEIIKNIESRDLDSMLKPGLSDPRCYILSAISCWDRTYPIIVNFIDRCSNDVRISKNDIEKVKLGKKFYFES